MIYRIVVRIKTVNANIGLRTVPGILWGLNKGWLGASLVVQWLRIRLPMQGTWVRALVREDPTCRGTT